MRPTIANFQWGGAVVVVQYLNLCPNQLYMPSYGRYKFDIQQYNAIHIVIINTNI